MLWVLWDIVLPLLVTFLLGLFLGWLLWRWRRSRIGAEDLGQLRRTSARYRSDAERLQQSNIELSDRLQAASGAGGGELASARKRIDMLAEELKSSRREVADLKITSRSGSQPSTIVDLQTELSQAKSRIVELERAGSATANVESSALVADLRREIESRDRMIATLRASFDQFGEHDDTTALMADIELRDRKIVELESVLATLRHK